MTARRVQRTYLLLTLLTTLAASFIWGINTLFLLDAGLSNLEAFAANAFFTAGHGALRGADRRRRGLCAGGGSPILLGTLTLAGSTLLYLLLWGSGAPFWPGPVVSMLLGLGLHLLLRRDRGVARRRAPHAQYEGQLEAGHGQGADGGRRSAMLAGSVLGGVIAQAHESRRAVPDARRRARR